MAPPPAAARTAADECIAAAADDGVEICFANPGTTEMWLVAGLDKESRIRSILGLHETVVTGACDGYARMARKPALALLHLGPGLCNGLANLHNARRAGSPVVTLVGDMASWHGAADPPLHMDITAAAGTVSRAVLRAQSPADVVPAMRRAVAAATGAVTTATAAGETAASDTMGNSRVVTLLVPHDFSWEPVAEGSGTAAAMGERSVGSAAENGLASSLAAAMPSLASSPAGRQFVRDCAAAMKACPRGKAALYIGGQALLGEGNALPNAGRIAAATGAALLCDSLFARAERGAGLPHMTRLPYFPQEAQAELRKYSLLVLVDARRPVAQFGYKDGPSQLVDLPDEAVWEIDASWGAADALAMLAGELGASTVTPLVNCRGVFASPGRPPLPAGRLSGPSVCAVVAALQPEGTLLVDESLTSGGSYWEASKGCPRFSHLCLTGGAIGSGPPMAVGAAVACPDRRVINLQADGSAMYSLQALWTQAREKLNVLTIILANNDYAILKVENARQRVPSVAKGTGAARGLTSLSQPAIDWVALAAGMGVPARAAATAEEFAECMRQGLATAGPFLIHAKLA